MFKLLKFLKVFEQFLKNTACFGQGKGKHINTLERFYIYIYKMRKNGTQMNDLCIDTHNPIFEIIQEENNR
jgi:hypothetical protein